MNTQQAQAYAPAPTANLHRPGRVLLLGMLIIVTGGCTAIPAQVAAPVDTAVPARSTAAALNDQDAALLAASTALADGQRTTFDGQILEAGRRYDAASGRSCRYLRLLSDSGTPAGMPRLVCNLGGARFLAADVFIVAPGTDW
ncbi:MAG: hypothetical protein R3F42_06755 [Pseudomonadota bacterium]